jgi:hypothetical protein
MWWKLQIFDAVCAGAHAVLGSESMREIRRVSKTYCTRHFGYSDRCCREQSGAFRKPPPSYVVADRGANMVLEEMLKPGLTNADGGSEIRATEIAVVLLVENR